jgi:hypothetical protein
LGWGVVYGVRVLVSIQVVSRARYGVVGDAEMRRQARLD